MTELQLYRFIHDNDIETNWVLKELLAFIPLYHLDDFHKLLPKGIFDDSGIKMWLKDGYAALDLVYICEYCGIEPENIIPRQSTKF
jgi:hypothetical protein